MRRTIFAMLTYFKIKGMPYSSHSLTTKAKIWREGHDLRHSNITTFLDRKGTEFLSLQLVSLGGINWRMGTEIQWKDVLRTDRIGQVNSCGATGTSKSSNNNKHIARIPPKTCVHSFLLEASCSNHRYKWCLKDANQKVYITSIRLICPDFR